MNSAILKPQNTRLDLLVEPRSPVTGAGPLARAISTLRVWTERARQRRHLGDLDQRLLVDIGLSEADVAIEARKPFWKA